MVPWKAWCASEVAQHIGKDAAYQAAMTVVLRGHHQAGDAQKEDVELCVDEEKTRWVRAEKALEPNALRLFPCAPKAPRFLAHSDHHHRATFTVKVAAKSADGGREQPCGQGVLPQP